MHRPMIEGTVVIRRCSVIAKDTCNNVIDSADLCIILEVTEESTCKTGLQSTVYGETMTPNLSATRAEMPEFTDVLES